uniref:Secreted protein n=2 Tax=Onchocerca ochengi TaxID=42157 RepID=A0A182EAH3_ONCOC
MLGIAAFTRASSMACILNRYRIIIPCGADQRMKGASNMNMEMKGRRSDRMRCNDCGICDDYSCFCLLLQLQRVPNTVFHLTAEKIKQRSLRLATPTRLDITQFRFLPTASGNVYATPPSSLFYSDSPTQQLNHILTTNSQHMLIYTSIY